MVGAGSLRRDLLRGVFIVHDPAEYQVRPDLQDAAQHPVEGESGGGLEAEYDTHDREHPHHEVHVLLRAGRGVRVHLLLLALGEPGEEELEAGGEEGQHEPAVVVALVVHLHKIVVFFFGFVGLQQLHLRGTEFAARETAVDEGVPDLFTGNVFAVPVRIAGLLTAEDDHVADLAAGLLLLVAAAGAAEAGAVAVGRDRLRLRHDGSKAAVRLPDVRDPEETVAFESIAGELLCLVRLSLIDDGLVGELNGLLITPEAERREEAEEQREGQQHRKAAGKAADAVFAHKLALLLVELLGIVCVFFFELIDLGLERRLLALGLPALDIREDLHEPQNERDDTLQKLSSVPEGETILAFDVSEQMGILLITRTETTNEKHICILNLDGDWIAAYSFDCAVSVGVAWEGSDICLFFTRGHVIEIINLEGRVKERFGLTKSSYEIDKLWNQLAHREEKSVNTGTYTLRTYGLFLIKGDHEYSQLVYTDCAEGEEIILYDASKTAMAKSLAKTVIVIVLFSVIIFSIIIQIKHNRNKA